MSETPAAEQMSSQGDEQSPTQKRRFLDRTRKVGRVLLAVDAWKSQTDILRHRLRFPLLRQVLAREIERRNTHIPMDNLSDSTVRLTKNGHAFIALAMAIGLFWSLITVTQGLAALIRWDVYFNSWLIIGVPLFVLTSIRLRASYLTYKVMKREILYRSNLPIADKEISE